MPISTETEIRDFLSKCRSVTQENLFLVSRDENKNTILKLGINNQIVKSIIYSLTEENYCEGPLPDRIYKGDVWIFGVTIDHSEIYIKLELSAYNDSGDEVPTLYCISFHFAKYTINYPYKTK